MTIENLKQRIVPLLKKHNIVRAGVFGSYAKGINSESSDVDILVELDKEMSLLDFIRIKMDLESLLDKKVDLVEYKALKPRLKNRILSEELRIYG
ncbi:nucleotidyltransferase family protein [Aequorivita todarodis]|uniref:nucleotidyltransferase family protein n=1 Tax=Aequorivita todarodis TaxID=2036821 RepID=UPI002350437A|nr:nucleotidyltransferase family protein [Aequorivita todarodis]MDC8001908.1 nucleotidyltransferase family protein [Aequorivita todarodis]